MPWHVSSAGWYIGYVLKQAWNRICHKFLGGVTVFIVRILAVKYQITLPILKGDEENSKE